MDLVCKKEDEFYTPPYAIRPILPYVPKGKTVWCPFDTEHSNFVRMLREEGHVVTATHIGTGHDFFKTEPKGDIIISNPPYSLKGEVFARLFELGRPFAMLVGVVGLFESENRFTMFAEYSFEIMYMNRRVAYFKDYSDPKPSLNPPFSSVYLCSGLLPRQMVFSRIQKT